MLAYCRRSLSTIRSALAKGAEGRKLHSRLMEAQGSGALVYEATPAAIQRASDTRTPPGVVAAVGIGAVAPESVRSRTAWPDAPHPAGTGCHQRSGQPGYYLPLGTGRRCRRGPTGTRLRRPAGAKGRARCQRRALSSSSTRQSRLGARSGA